MNDFGVLMFIPTLKCVISNIKGFDGALTNTEWALIENLRSEVLFAEMSFEMSFSARFQGINGNTSHNFLGNSSLKNTALWNLIGLLLAKVFQRVKLLLTL